MGEKLSACKIPVLLMIFYTLYMLVLIPAYWVNYGPGNFLWISDITLILTFIGVLLEKSLLISMAAVGGLALELFWILSFFSEIIFNVHISGIADYMFDSSLPLWLRSLSLFHIWLPILLIWLVMRLGYKRKAVIIQIALTALILPLSWLLTHSSENVNWVYSYQKLQLNPYLYLFVEWVVISCVIAITHVCLTKLSQKSSCNAKLWKKAP